METVVGMNKASATRNARTAMTGAQNAGRQQAYERAAAMGIKVKKEWIATLDGRTRHSHGMADGQQVEIDGKFKVGASELHYPGDPQGRPEEIYNCRCTMVTVEPPEILRGEEPRRTYPEWVQTKEGQAELEKARIERNRKAAKRRKAKKKQQNNAQNGLKSGGNSGIIKEKSPKIRKSVDKKPSKSKPTSNISAINSGTIRWDNENKVKLIRTEMINNGNNYETAYVYDDTGKIKFKVKGTKDEVKFTKKQHKEMKGCVVTHNHPLNSSFSPDDIYLLKTSGASEIRASTQFGTYVLRPPLEWSEKLMTLEDIDEIYNSYIDDFISRYKDKAAQEGKHLLTYLQKAEEEATKAFAEQYGLDFKLEKYTKESYNG